MMTIFFLTRWVPCPASLTGGSSMLLYFKPGSHPWDTRIQVTSKDWPIEPNQWWSLGCCCWCGLMLMFDVFDVLMWFVPASCPHIASARNGGGCWRNSMEENEKVTFIIETFGLLKICSHSHRICSKDLDYIFSNEGVKTICSANPVVWHWGRATLWGLLLILEPSRLRWAKT